jgi:NhaP-type Na+/H+ or K+/H+ antiporter
MKLFTVGLVVLLLVLAAPVYAQSEIPTFDSWLILASGTLVAAIVGFLLSWVVEYWPKYNSLKPRYKRLSFLGMCLIVPILAATLRGLLGYAAWSFDPLYWHALWNGFAAFGVGEIAHTRKLPK